MSTGIITDLFNSTVDKPQKLIDTFSTGTVNGTKYIPNFDSTNGWYLSYPDQGNAQTDAAVYPTLDWNNTTKIMTWTFQNNTRAQNQFLGGVNVIQGPTQKRSVQIYCIQYGGNYTSTDDYGFALYDNNNELVIDSTFRSLAFANQFTAINPSSPQNYQPPGGGITGYYIRNLGDLADGTHGTYVAKGGSPEFDGDDALCACTYPSTYWLHGMGSDSLGNPALNITNNSGSGGATIEQWIIAPATSSLAGLNNNGLVIFDANGNITFDSGQDYAELLGAAYISNIQNLSLGGSYQINHNAAKSGYKPAYLFTVTVPSTLYEQVGAYWPSNGSKLYYYGLQPTSSTQCEIRWRHSFNFPTPRQSTFYNGIKITGRIDANVAVFQVPV
jgi:hypothetical protein